MENLEIETHKLFFPWSISKGEFQKYTELNHSFNSKFIDKHCIEVPEETTIDLSPLLPLPLHISNNSITIAKPLPELIKFNNNLNIETLSSTKINLKSMADLPTRQNGELLRQLANWTSENGLISPNDSRSRFKLGGPHLDMELGPDAAYFPFDLHNELPRDVKEDNTTPFAPSFVIESRSYSKGQNNDREYQIGKMCTWIEGGAESGILVDGKSRIIDLFCQTNILVHQQNTENLLIHPQVQMQQEWLPNELARFQNELLALHQVIDLIPPPITRKLQTTLNYFQNQVIKLNHLNQVYFNNMSPVLDHPNVSRKSIPFWSNQINEEPEHGPIMIIHCIGDVNGFMLDLSTYPMV